MNNLLEGLISRVIVYEDRIHKLEDELHIISIQQNKLIKTFKINKQNIEGKSSI